MAQPEGVATQPAGLGRLWSQHPMMVVLVGAIVAGVFVVLGAATTPWVTELFQRGRDTEAAKKDVMTALSNASSEIGAFLVSATEHPADIDTSFAAHESKMKDHMAVVRSSQALLAARDLDTKTRFENIVREISDSDTCLTRIYREMRPGPRRAFAFNELRRGYLSATAGLTTTLPKIAAGGYSDAPFRMRCEVPPGS